MMGYNFQINCTFLLAVRVHMAAHSQGLASTASCVAWSTYQIAFNKVSKSKTLPWICLASSLLGIKWIQTVWGTIGYFSNLFWIYNILFLHMQSYRISLWVNMQSNFKAIIKNSVFPSPFSWLPGLQKQLFSVWGFSIYHVFYLLVLGPRHSLCGTSYQITPDLRTKYKFAKWGHK